MSASSSLPQDLELHCEDILCIADQELGELGCSLQSSVRLAHHYAFGLVAVKCFAVTGGRPERAALERKIKRELRLLQHTTNEYIVRIYGWVKWPKAIGLVMEYFPVGSLRQFFTGNCLVKLTPKVIVRMASEIAAALACMHNLPSDQRLIHGDVKPENVLLTTDLHCKVGDFGSAELVAMTGSTTIAIPRRRKLDMTLAYAAPEKLKCLNIKAKKEQDSYSFGMLLYVLLAGTTPYHHISQEITFAESIKEGERPDTTPISELKDTLGSSEQVIVEKLESIMRRCWQQDPCDRLEMIDVREELQEIRDQLSCSDILAEVTEMVKILSVSAAMPKYQALVPLSRFSPITGTFTEVGAIYNIYNLPNVQQAALQCEEVTFGLPESAGPSTSAEQPKETYEERRPSHSFLSRLRCFTKRRRPQTARSSSKVPGRRPHPKKATLYEIFKSSDPSTLPANAMVGPDLLTMYKEYLNKGKLEKARKEKAKLIQFVENQVNATAEDMRLFAENLRSEGLFLESIAFFDAAATLCEKMKRPKDDQLRMTQCMEGLNKTNTRMISNNVSMKPIVKDHVIPIMREKVMQMEATFETTEEWTCLQMAWALHHIELSEKLVDQWHDRGKTLGVAISKMRHVFGSNSSKHRIYGILLNNLGVVYCHLERYSEAESLLQQAIEVHREATDYVEERVLDIEQSERGLKMIEELKK